MFTILISAIHAIHKELSGSQEYIRNDILRTYLIGNFVLCINFEVFWLLRPHRHAITRHALAQKVHVSFGILRGVYDVMIDT